MKKYCIAENIILVKKLTGITSFDVVAAIRRKLHVKKVGHAGTLDPMAEGLLIIGVGSGTKQLGHFLKLPKTYEAGILLGMRTDTGDVTGKILETKIVEAVDPAKLETTISSVQGKLLLPVPAYSAIKVSGERLYARARAGEKFTPPTKEMEIVKIENGGTTKNDRGIEIKLILRVSSGTYIRSIAEELGRRLGVPATLSSLRRTSIGDYLLSDALEIQEVDESVLRLGKK